MDKSTPTSAPTAPEKGALITISIGLDELTIGTLRWLTSIADASGLDDSDQLFPVYNEQWTDIIEGLELYVNASSLPNLAGRHE